MTPEMVKGQIDDITTFLIAQGFCDDQEFPGIRNIGGRTFVGIDMRDRGSIMLRDIPYSELFEILSTERLFSARLADGAILQFLFEFDRGSLQKNRMAYFPAPEGDYFRDSHDLFAEDTIYSEIVRASYVPIPFRFDYDRTISPVSRLAHPYSHFTLGAFQSCRVPVSSPLTPLQFMNFILQHFYYQKITTVAQNAIPTSADMFEQCISEEERNTMHLLVG